MYNLESELQRFTPALQVQGRLSRRTQTTLRTTFFILLLLCVPLLVTTHLLYPMYFQISVGVSLLILCGWIEQVLLFSYCNSYYYAGLRSLLHTTETTYTGITYEVASILSKNPTDIGRAFCESSLGFVVLVRAGVSNESITTYCTSTRASISASSITLPPYEPFTLVSLGSTLVRLDQNFVQLLASNGITAETFLKTLSWVHDTILNEKQSERWWSRANLSKTKGIGREWTYGATFMLDRFARPLSQSAVFTGLGGGDTAFSEKTISEIEVALARAKASNVLVIGNEGVGTTDIIQVVEKRRLSGVAIGSVTETRFVVLDTTRLFAVHATKQELEVALLTILNEAVAAGNIIIVIEHISTVIREAAAIGVFLPELIDPYLATTALHIIATDTPNAYHTHLETLPGFTRRFSEVLLETPSIGNTIHVLQNIAFAQENRYGVLFTYPSIEAVATAADRHIVEGVMPDKAIELLIDVATRSAYEKQSIVTREFVYKIVGDKTGIPVGPINASERDTLLHLEESLHARVIGQQPALNAIARTMRRARAGIESHDKPIGSFLFLGPTGVGKTEAAKALAHVFFGSESAMIRFDMSEYSSSDSLVRLLGDSTHGGLLSDALREHPYAVVLLDEFEKAHRVVHDLFLQILDEGVCTDGRGTIVNARNTIIIATSNAGSALILKTVEERQALATLEQEIINHIIETGVYRPELLNRFDATVIFEPLTLQEQYQVARLMLTGLYARVEEQGYALTVDDALLQLIVQKGYSPQFGARPLQRVLQNIIEEKVAQKIIAGTVTHGGTIMLTPQDFTAAELNV